MGRRSRKRAGEAGAPSSENGSTRAERDAARRARAARARAGKPPPRAGRRGSGRPPLSDRPKPPWAPFPLTELLVLAGIVLMAWGFVAGAGREANAKLAAGLAIASIAGIELAVREHLTGFRSHTTLLAGALAIATILVLGLVAGVGTLGPLLLAAAIVFAASFYGLRQLFK
ncbi:MAG: hypothetical protein WD399_11185, partial [Thermoleophilaceae bacterium]